MTATDRAYVLGPDEGQASWFAGALMILKAGTADTGGQFALLDQRVPGGYAVPRHVHHSEDEAWYILEGEATFYCGEQTFAAGPGSWVFLPKDVPHTFKVGAAGARLLTLTDPSGFADFVREASEPATELTIPHPAPLDVPRLAELAAKYNAEIIGPPPD
jgi:mannose-6-phosphate isomerase-like protein (cupin superfamily)